MQRWINLAGAATSVALILGLVVWGYRLAVRDVSGVPIIRAMEGPARIAPEDPGGDLARHVGLSVNAVAGNGTAAGGPDKVALAPEDVGLAPEDMPMGDLAALAPAPQADAAAALPEAAPDTKDDITAALQAEELPEAEEPATAAPAPESAAPNGVIPASVPGVNSSPRPIPRPERDLLADALEAELAGAGAAGEAAQAAAEAVDIDPASLPEGTRLVQIGAYDSVEEAQAEWRRVAGRFESLMEGKKRVIQEASSGGRTFYRLRIHGFDDVTDARRFCAALVAERTNCIPAQVR